MKQEDYKKLKVGDTVETKYKGVKATVMEVDVWDGMVRLKTETRVHSCPYYYKNELK